MMCVLCFFLSSAPKLKGRKRRKKLSGLTVNEASRGEQAETRAKAVSTLLQVEPQSELLHTVDSAFHPPWDGEMSIGFRAE